MRKQPMPTRFLLRFFLLPVLMIFLISVPCMAHAGGDICPCDKHSPLPSETRARLPNSETNPNAWLQAAAEQMTADIQSGHHRLALETARAGEATLNAATDPAARARFRCVHGDALTALGRQLDALDQYNLAVDDARKAAEADPAHRITLAATLNDTAILLASADLAREAVALLDEALELSETIQNPDLKARILANTSRLALAADLPEEARTAWGQAVAAPPETIRALVTLAEIGRSLMGLSDTTPAEKPVTADQVYSLLTTAETMATGADLALVLERTGGLYEDTGQLADALTLTRRGIFTARQAEAPQILYRLLWQEGRILAALDDASGAETAFKEAAATLTPIRGELFSGYRSGQDSFGLLVKPVYTGLVHLLLKKAESADNDVARQKILLEARNVVEELKSAELQDVFRDECAAAGTGELASAARMPAGTALLHPILLPDRVVTLVTTSEGLRQYPVMVTDTEMVADCLRFRRRLQTRTDNRFFHDARLLYDRIIRPAMADPLVAEAGTLVIAPDGPLRQFPFSALHDGTRFLVETKALAVTPSLTLTRTDPMDLDQLRVFLGGLSEAVDGFSPLPSVPGELADIRKITNSRMTPLLNREFRADALADQFRAADWSVVHLATHGIFEGLPENTFLLTHDGPLTLDQLESIIGIGRYREKPLELLTLSACQTALGDERSALGLAGVAVKSGAASALATLWYVDDEATALTIRNFYRHLMKPETGRATALQAAQKELIATKRFRHPIYWSPFLLIGNWN